MEFRWSEPSEQEFRALWNGVYWFLWDTLGSSSPDLFVVKELLLDTAVIRVWKRNDGSRRAFVDCLSLGVCHHFDFLEEETPEGVILVARVATQKQPELS